MRLIERDGKIYPEYRLNKNGRMTERCVFCGKTHTHGLVDGHRLPHCNRSMDTIQKIVDVGGIQLYHENGYYVTTIKK